MTEKDDIASGDVFITAVTDWLMLQALGHARIEDIFDGCCQRLYAAGLPISRAMLTFGTLHPLYASTIMYWRRGEDVRSSRTRHEDAFSSEQFNQSPIHRLMNSRTPFLRRRLRGSTSLLDFPVLEDLKEQGAADYLAYKVGFSSAPDQDDYQDGIIGSWTTDRANGFTDQELNWLTRVQSRLAVACKVQIQHVETHDVLDAYLGPNAGHRVREGQIRRGDGERIETVIWYSDMRDSSRWADELPADQFLKLVNGYFECTAGAVMQNGGEVLRFIGDAVLAIFPVLSDGNDPQLARVNAATRAMQSAREAEKRLLKLNAGLAEKNKSPIDFGLGLHIGELTFGNIGIAERLEFTVVGAVANEVARLESLSKQVGRRILVSENFASLVDIPWQSVGEHKLRGVTNPVVVMSPQQNVDQ